MNDEISLVPEQAIEDPKAEAHERKVQEQQDAQFKQLRRQARGHFDVVKGLPGAFREDYWEKAFHRAKLDYDSGKFLMRRLGAERQLDLELVATLTQLRQQLLEGIENPSASDHMLADTAILAYRNLIRIQSWIGSVCVVVERELFGQEPLSDYGATVGERIERDMHQFQQSLMPLLDRAHRMLVRSLDRLEARRSGRPQAQVSIGHAKQVNVASAVQNVDG